MKRTDIKKRPLSDTTLENLEAENTLYHTVKRTAKICIFR
mgnify:CR=1 FL=1